MWDSTTGQNNNSSLITQKLNPDAPKTMKEDKHKNNRTTVVMKWKHVAQEYQVVSFLFFCYNLNAVVFGGFKVQTNLS